MKVYHFCDWDEWYDLPASTATLKKRSRCKECGQVWQTTYLFNGTERVRVHRWMPNIRLMVWRHKERKLFK